MKLTKTQRRRIEKCFRDNMLSSLLEFEQPKESARILLESLPWPLGDTEAADAMNAGIREAAEIIVNGGSTHDI